MFRRFILYIEREPWDEAMERQDKWLEKFCWVVIILSALYFIPVCLGIFER